MDLFYRFEPRFGGGYGPPNASELGQSLSAASARLAYSMIASLSYLTPSLRDEFLAVLNPDTLWALALVFAAWGFGTVLGGAVGLAVNVLLIGYGLIALWGELNRAAEDLKEWFLISYNAQNNDDLESAGKRFAAALANGGMRIIEVVVAHRVFRAVETRIRKKYPPPKTLETEFEARKRSVNEASEKEKSGKLREVAEKIKSSAEAARGPGARNLANEFPTAEVAVTVAAIAVGGGLLLLLSDSKS